LNALHDLSHLLCDIGDVAEDDTQAIKRFGRAKGEHLHRNPQLPQMPVLMLFERHKIVGQVDSFPANGFKNPH